MGKVIEGKFLTKMGERGQLVIPHEIRDTLNLKTGSVFQCASINNTIVIHKIEIRLKKEDIKTLKNLEKIWKEIERGKFEKFTKKEFKEKLKNWDW